MPTFGYLWLMWKPFILVPLAVVSSCSDTCSNTTIARVDAPDRHHSAVLFQRDCGATTGFSTQISIAEASEQPVGAGNAFRADDNYGKAAVGNWGGALAEMKWAAADHLIVRYAAGARVFEQTNKISGVQISYVAVNR